MNILYSEFYNVNIKENKIEQKFIEEEFNGYIERLVEFVVNNKNTRQFKIQSENTEVISNTIKIAKKAIKKITEEITEEMNKEIHKYMEGIAKRLLKSEIELQEQLQKMGQHVKSGSLLVSIIDKDIEEGGFYCIISKVEDNGFFDRENLKLRYGFSSEVLKVWRSTIIEVEIDSELEEMFIGEIHVFLDKQVTYWTKTFLEIEEKIGDETNTTKAYKYSEMILRTNLKKQAPADYTTLKYHLIGHMKREGLFTYNTMLDEIFDTYEPTQIKKEKLKEIKEKLLKLPGDKGFDNQFNLVPKCIKARIRSIYKIATGISLKIESDATDVEKNILIEQADNGERFIKIKLTDEETYRAFKK